MAATTIALSAGNAQLGYPSTALPVPLAVLVTDGAGLPVAGVTVNWQIGAGGGSLSGATSATNASGIASITFTLGANIAPQIVTADVAGLAGTPVAFTAQSVIITPTDVTRYYRIETQAEVVNGLLAELIAEAQGEIEASCGKALVTESVLWYDNAQTLRMGESVTNLILKYVPIDPATLVVKDVLGNVIPAAGYILRQDLGLICALPFSSGAFLAGPSTTFDNGPYTMTATAGFGTATNYATRWLPMIRRTVLDYVGYLFQQRDVGASSLKAAGTSVTYVLDPLTGLPDRCARAIRKLRGPVVTSQ